MNIHNRRTNLRAEMNAEPTFDYAERLVVLERINGATLSEAIGTVARRARMGHGSLENIIRKRVKRIDGRIRDRLRSVLIAMLERRIEGDRNELEMVRAGTRDGDSDAELLAEIQTDMEALHARIRKLRG